MARAGQAGYSEKAARKQWGGYNKMRREAKAREAVNRAATARTPALAPF